MKTLYTINDFSKGLNVKDAPNLIALNTLVDAENAVVQKGAISKRHGYERYISTQVERTATWQDIGGMKWSDM